MLLGVEYGKGDWRGFGILDGRLVCSIGKSKTVFIGFYYSNKITFNVRCHPNFLSLFFKLLVDILSCWNYRFNEWFLSCLNSPTCL